MKETTAKDDSATRAAYYRAIEQFLASSESAGYRHLEDSEPSPSRLDGRLLLRHRSTRRRAK